MTSRTDGALAIASRETAAAGSLRLAARQFPRNRAATVGLVCLVVVCLLTAAAPWIAPYDPIQIKLAAKLQDQGIQLTRRTVAKYREDMNIPSTHQRRQRDA